MYVIRKRMHTRLCAPTLSDSLFVSCLLPLLRPKPKVDHQFEKKDLPDVVKSGAVTLSDFKGQLDKVPLCDVLLSNNYFKDSFEISFNNPRVTHQEWTGTRWCRWGGTVVNFVIECAT
jgi:hypothetical protein